MWNESQGSLPLLCLIEPYLTEVYCHSAVMEINQDTNTHKLPVQQLKNNKSFHPEPANTSLIWCVNVPFICDLQAQILTEIMTDSAIMIVQILQPFIIPLNKITRQHTFHTSLIDKCLKAARMLGL